MFISINSKTFIKRMRFLIWVLFILYCAFMLKVLLFDSFRLEGHQYYDNLIPFKTIWMYIEYSHLFHFKIWAANLIGNIVLFMPIGFVVPLLSRKMKGFRKIFLLSFLSTAAIEITQHVFNIGGFDVDDILLNTIGGIMGYLTLILLFAILSFFTAQQRFITYFKS
ncbi:VanZ family protein [Heyndrickxia acidicola]|uniref:VanZ family protein n=1 Tax=Heyndrickxia acidicola TaxID=209389 RepID=A0ABU6MAU7_9BACI|nr:VanZ family protein [Heyndrickxia acidicola]MED1201751.1 VanZ family protein [Heyndrickxia acidicola]